MAVGPEENGNPKSPKRCRATSALHKMLINGSVVSSDKLFDVINPSTGEAFATCPDCSKEQCLEAVAAAKAASKTWKHSSYEERKALLTVMIEKTEANKQALAELLVKEQGKPLSGALGEVGSVGTFLRGFQGLKVEDKVLIDNDTEKVVQMHVPLGVVGGICPWNFPLTMAAWKIGEAVMTGNTIVVKSSPFTPLVTNMWAELIADIAPPGVVNILSGGNQCGEWLVEHPDIDKISFTGSVRTGKIIQARAAATLKRVTLELGGNDAAIILDDADPSKVAPKVLGHAMANTGQVCIAVKRCYVPKHKYRLYVDEFVKAVDNHKLGDGFETGVTMGPLNNKMQYDRVIELVEDAKANGAKVEAGGAPLGRPGYFYPPTVLSNCPHGMRVVDEEQFGPVLPILPYESESEVINYVNDTSFGLGGSVWGEAEHAAEVARHIDSGTVWVNSHMNLTPDIMFGGRKCSGIGRQMGSATIAGYTDAKILRMPKTH